MPPGLTAEEARILKSVRRRSHYLDKGFHICGIRFGWTFLIGLIPVLGSATDAALGYKLVIAKCKTADIVCIWTDDGLTYSDGAASPAQFAADPDATKVGR